MKKTSVIVLIVSLTLWLFGIPSVNAQSKAPVSLPTSTPNPIPTLQTMIATQQVQIDEQERQITYAHKDISRVAEDWQWKWGVVGMIVGAIGTILASAGFNSVTDMKKRLTSLEKDFAKQLKQTDDKWEKQLTELERNWEERSTHRMNYLLEKFDLRKLPIYIPNGEGRLKRRLELSGLTAEEYTELGLLTVQEGVIVVKFSRPDDKDSDPRDQFEFRNFVEVAGLDPNKVAFVLFAEPSSVKPATINCFENLVIGNFPATVVSNILAVGRGLQIEERESI